MADTALLLIILIPLIGAGFAALIKPVAVTRIFALVIAFLSFVLAIVIALAVEPATPVRWGVQGTNPLAIPEIGFGVKLACDGISMWLVLLATTIAPLAILAVGKEIDDQPNAPSYYAWMLLLLSGIIGTFLAADALLFYFFFELTLIPSLLLIGIWGGPARREAAAKFFIYTFAGSIFLLVSIIYLASRAGSFEIDAIIALAHSNGTNALSDTELLWCGLGLLVGFLIKTPVFPLHTWQPLAYAEAPMTTTVMLAAVLGKLGTYGLIRLTLPIAFADPSVNESVRHIVVVVCLISIVYGGLIAWVQKDLIRLVAYSSLSHLGLCVLAIFASNTLSVQGAVMYMLAHGLSTAALVLVIGMIARRTKTRDISEMSGLFAKMPVLSTLLVLFVMASIGLPITSGFVGEFLSLQGVMMAYGLPATIIAATGMVLGAIYMLHMVAKIGFGPLKAPQEAQLYDLCPRETLALLPLAFAVLAVGITPTPILDSFKTDAARLAKVDRVAPVAPAPVEEGFFGQ